MSLVEIFLLALALSIDACVVSFSYGICFNKNRLKNSILLAISTGFFQGLMPCIGYYLTNLCKTYIEPYAKLIVFLIFVYLGIKFVKEAFDKNKNKPNCIGIICLLLIGIATSIDAFSAGITLSLCGNTILKPVLLITGITFINSIFGFWIGQKLKNLSTKYLEITAGLILIGLGIKAFF